MRSIVAILAVILSLSIRAQSKTTGLLQMRASAHGCKGTCPVWDIDVRQHKSVDIMAVDHMPVNGWHGRQLSDKEYRKLIKLVNAIDTATIQEVYRSRISDQPQYSFNITYMNGKSMFVLLEDGAGAPRSIYRLLRYFKKLEKKLERLWGKPR